jgi:hypothetical protein
MTKILFFLMTFISVVAMAQDPDVGGTTIKGTIGDGSGPHADGEAISFTIDAGNAGTTMAYPPPSNAPFEINITLGHFDAPVVSVAPGFTNYFAAPVVTLLNPAIPTYTIVITQTAAIPESEYTRFIISGKAKGSNGDLVQYQANGDPGGYPNVGTDDPSSSAEILGSTLPVTLTSFHAVKENTVVNLAWSTAVETNSDRFDVEHSTDAKVWSRIGTVHSSGESKRIQNYSFSHTSPVRSMNYYRLKMVDLDGTYAFSAIRGVEVEKAAVSIYPNPVADVLTIGASVPDLSRVQLYSTSGVSVYDSGSTVTNKISVSNLSGGIYLVKLSYRDGTSDTRKIVVKK